MAVFFMLLVMESVAQVVVVLIKVIRVKSSTLYGRRRLRKNETTVAVMGMTDNSIGMIGGYIMTNVALTLTRRLVCQSSG